MSLEVHFRGGAEAGRRLAFDDSIQQITFGRDPQLCQVVFPPDMTQVGREHFALQRQIGHYRLVLNRSAVVLLNGQRAVDGQELPNRAEIQVGQGGPQLVLLTTASNQLPETVGRSPEAGQVTRLRGAERTARTGRRLALLALVALLAALPLGYYAWKSASADPALRLRNALRTAAPSVYLVIKRSADGSIDPVATAWVADQSHGILATNGHVATEFSELRPDQTLIARSCSTPPMDFPIASVQIHPGYQEFQELWGTYGPAIRTSPVRVESVSAPGTGCDVALMYVRDAVGLGATLPLAPPVELQALQAGYPVGYVGYPMEGLALGGVNVDAPMPATHLAYIVGCTNYFGLRSATEAERLLVQHALPATGGASGSPIINANGQVVAILSGVNFIGTTNSGRIGSSANISFGQRSDLVEELLSQSAEARQVDRLDHWKSEISQHYGKLDALARAAKLQQGIETQRGDWQTEIEDRQRNQATVELVGAFTLKTPDDPGAARNNLKQAVHLAAGGKYLFVAAGTNSISFGAHITPESGEPRELSSEGPSDEQEEHCRFIRTQLDAPAECELTVQAEADTEILVHCYKASVTKISPDQIFENQLAAWLKKIHEFVSPGASAALLQELHPELDATPETYHGKPVAFADLGKLAAGEYLAIVVPNGNEELDLWMIKVVANDQYQLVTRDETSRAWSICPLTLREPASIKAMVFGLEKTSVCTLRLYRTERGTLGEAKETTDHK